MAKKQLRVGMIGYGFMGRAHSNAYKQVGQFFPSQHEVVLKAAELIVALAPGSTPPCASLTVPIRVPVSP